MRDTMEPIDLHQKKSELLSANNPRRPATQATKAADNAANDAYKAVLKDLETINTELKDKTPTNLSLANQVSIRKALISYETNSKEVLNNITTNVHAPKSMAHIFSRLDVKPAVIQKQLVESKKERKKLAISIPSNNIIAPATPSPVSGNTSSIPETPTSSISGTPSPTSSVQPSSPGLNSPTAEIDSPRNTSPKP